MRFFFCFFHLPFLSSHANERYEQTTCHKNYILQKIKETSGEEFTAAAVLGSDVPPEKETFRYWNVVGLGIVEPKKPFEKHWTHSEAQKNINSREDDEVMNDTQEPSELVPRHENQVLLFVFKIFGSQ